MLGAGKSLKSSAVRGLKTMVTFIYVVDLFSIRSNLRQLAAKEPRCLFQTVSSKAIGFVYPNDKCDGDMRDYAVTVDDVEKITGLDFFYQLDDKTEKAVESKCNPAAWGF